MTSRRDEFALLALVLVLTSTSLYTYHLRFLNQQCLWEKVRPANAELGSQGYYSLATLEADAKFPGSENRDVELPSPSRENPGQVCIFETYRNILSTVVGQVYPKSDISRTSQHRTHITTEFLMLVYSLAAPPGSVPGSGVPSSSEQFLGNPYLQTGIFQKLDQALTEAIRIIEGEQSSVGGSANETNLIRKFESWRDELEEIMSGRAKITGNASPTDGAPSEKGGLFTD